MERFKGVAKIASTVVDYMFPPKSIYEGWVKKGDIFTKDPLLYPKLHGLVGLISTGVYTLLYLDYHRYKAVFNYVKLLVDKTGIEVFNTLNIDEHDIDIYAKMIARGVIINFMLYGYIKIDQVFRKPEK